jgi:hypothetical protein
MTIYRYAVAAVDGELDETYETYAAATKRADQLAQQEGQPHAVIEFEFEFADSGLVYATDGSVEWPPRKEEK